VRVPKGINSDGAASNQKGPLIGKGGGPGDQIREKEREQKEGEKGREKKLGLGLESPRSEAQPQNQELGGKEKLDTLKEDTNIGWGEEAKSQEDPGDSDFEPWLLKRQHYTKCKNRRRAK